VPSVVNPVTGDTQNVLYYANNSEVPLLVNPRNLAGGWSGCAYARYRGDAYNDNDAEHRQHGPADRRQVPLLDGEGDVRADARELDRRIADADRLRGHDEEPAAVHRHHHVPHQPGHSERHLDAPEPQPGREAEAAGGFVQILGQGAQALIEAERHVPSLAREDGEDGRQFRAHQAAREQRHEGDDGDGNESQDRHRLQDVEDRHQQDLRPPHLGRQSGIGEGEEERGEQRQDHPQRGPQGVFRQDARIERDGGSRRAGQRHRHLPRGVSGQREQRDDQDERDAVPVVGQDAASVN